MARRDRTRAFLEADLSTVRSLLEDIPRTEVLERMGLEARLKDVEARLAEAKELDLNLPRAVDLYFGGDPVVGSAGVDARFASKAVAAFQRAISAAAVTEGTVLGARGPLPDDLATLHITDVIHGSFGFRLEELGQQELTDTTSRLGQGIDRVEEVLDSLLKPDAEVFVDAVSDIDSRVVTALKEFMNTLGAAGAVCRIVSEEREVKFPTIEIAKEAARRISTYNVEESEEQIEGVLLGILPEARRFEHRATDGQVLRGKIGRKVGNPQVLQRFVESTCFALIKTTLVSRTETVSRRHTLLGVSRDKQTLLF